METERLECGGGIKAAFELEMLLKAAGELSLYCSCNKTLPEALRDAEALEPQAKLLLTIRNVLQSWDSLHEPPPSSVAAKQRGFRSPLHHDGPPHKAI